MELVILNNEGLPELKPEVKAIPVFHEILKRVRRGKSSKIGLDQAKRIQLNEFLYIFYMADYKSWAWQKYPFDSEKRHSEILNTTRLFAADWKPDDKIQEGIEVYQQMMETPQLRLIRAALRACNTLIDRFETIDTSKFDPGKVLKWIADVDDHRENLEKVVRKMLSTERKSEGKVRGGGVVNYFENPDKKRLQEYVTTTENIQRDEGNEGIPE